MGGSSVRVGSDVMYVVKSGDIEKGMPPVVRPAKVVQVWGSGDAPAVNVVVFIDGSNDYHLLGSPPPPVQVVNAAKEKVGEGVIPFAVPVCWKTSVGYATDGRANSWYFGPGQRTDTCS